MEIKLFDQIHFIKCCTEDLEKDGGLVLEKDDAKYLIATLETLQKVEDLYVEINGEKVKKIEPKTTYIPDFSPDWKGDPDDENRWKGW